MDRDTLLELLNEAQFDLENFYISGSNTDIESSERFCADIERNLAKFEINA